MDRAESAQLPLQFNAPRARRSDPASSQHAAAEASKFAASQAAEVLRLVIANPGRTTKQLGSLGRLDRYQVARRVPELEADGWIWRDGAPGEELRLHPTDKALRWLDGRAA